MWVGGFIVAFWPRKPRDSGMQLAYFRFCRRIHALFAPISCRTADDDNSINIEISVYYLFQIGLGRTKPLSRAVSGFVCLFTICVCVCVLCGGANLDRTRCSGACLHTQFQLLQRRCKKSSRRWGKKVHTKRNTFCTNDDNTTTKAAF